MRSSAYARDVRRALHMSALGGKADMPFCTAYVAFDPKRTSRGLTPNPPSMLVFGRSDALYELRGEANEATRVHHMGRRHCSVASRRACAATGDAGDRISRQRIPGAFSCEGLLERLE